MKTIAPATEWKRRPARPDEWPAFGSVWTWSNLSDLPLVALCRGPSQMHDGLTVVFFRPTPGIIDHGWEWTDSTGKVLPGWACIEEGASL